MPRHHPSGSRIGGLTLSGSGGSPKAEARLCWRSLRRTWAKGSGYGHSLWIGPTPFRWPRVSPADSRPHSAPADTTSCLWRRQWQWGPRGSCLSTGIRASVRSRRQPAGVSGRYWTKTRRAWSGTLLNEWVVETNAALHRVSTGHFGAQRADPCPDKGAESVLADIEGCILNIPYTVTSWSAIVSIGETRRDIRALGCSDSLELQAHTAYTVPLFRFVSSEGSNRSPEGWAAALSPSGGWFWAPAP